MSNTLSLSFLHVTQELVQNADDAGAKNVIFMYDKRYHSKEHLWSESLRELNGPSLYVYNDATFRGTDWKNIQNPEQSGKHNDPTKVGRFGLGFISVYHLTGKCVIHLTESVQCSLIFLLMDPYMFSCNLISWA